MTASIQGLQNYNDTAGTATITIAKASSTTVTVGAGPFTFDGTTHAGGSGIVTGAGGLNTSATSLTYSGDQVNAGTYLVTAHYAGDPNHLPSDGLPVAINIGKARVSGFATTQDALNIAKQGSLSFALNNITGLIGTDTVISVFSHAFFTLKFGSTGRTYTFQPTVTIDTHGDTNMANDTVILSYSLNGGGTAGELAADLLALDAADGTVSTSASNAQVDAIWVDMSTDNYWFYDDALTRIFNSKK